MADDHDMDDLNGFFAAARRETASLPPDLEARILRDAEAAQRAAAAPVTRARPGVWRQFLTVLGGWPAMGGLVAACAAGVWIGVAPPAFLPDPLALLDGAQAELDLLGTYEMSTILTEDQ